MLKHEDNAVARINGNNLQPLAGVSVTVTDKVTGLPASLYQDNEATPIPQPLVTDNNGYYGFKAADGTYVLTFSGQRIQTFTREITLDDPKDNPYVTVAGLAAGQGAAGVGYGGRTVADKLGDFLTPLDGPFNAIGDGTADDTAAVQACKALAEATGRAMFLPAGYVFTCSSDFVLNNSTTLIGAGQGVSTLKMTGTGKIVSNRSAVVDYADVRDFKVLQGGTAQVGMDIGTLRRSLVQNVYVQGFKIGVSLDIGVSGVANYWNRLFNVTADCTGQSAAGSVGFLLGNNVNATYPDTDYNNLVGCKSFNCETAIKGVNMIGCKIMGHQATVVGTALDLVSGNNNGIQITAENCLHMGSAGTAARGNKLDLYNDGGNATAFVDNGWNHHSGHIIGAQIMDSPIKTGDSFVQDRINSAVVAASTNLFRITLGVNEFAATVTLTCAGYTQGTAEFAGVQVWDVTRVANGTPTVTLIRSTGDNKFTVTTAADGSCTWVIAGNASNLSVANTSVSIQGIGTPQAAPYMGMMTYTRLVP